MHGCRVAAEGHLLAESSSAILGKDVLGQLAPVLTMSLSINANVFIICHQLLIYVTLRPLPSLGIQLSVLIDDSMNAIVKHDICVVCSNLCENLIEYRCCDSSVTCCDAQVL